MGQDTGYGMMGKESNPNLNNRTEKEYRALIRTWCNRLKLLTNSDSYIEDVIKEMEKEVPQ